MVYLIAARGQDKDYNQSNINPPKLWQERVRAASDQTLTLTNKTGVGVDTYTNDGFGQGWWTFWFEEGSKDGPRYVIASCTYTKDGGSAIDINNKDSIFKYDSFQLANTGTTVSGNGFTRIVMKQLIDKTNNNHIGVYKFTFNLFEVDDPFIFNLQVIKEEKYTEKWDSEGKLSVLHGPYTLTDNIKRFKFRPNVEDYYIFEAAGKEGKESINVIGGGFNETGNSVRIKCNTTTDYYIYVDINVDVDFLIKIREVNLKKVDFSVDKSVWEVEKKEDEEEVVKEPEQAAEEVVKETTVKEAEEKKEVEATIKEKKEEEAVDKAVDKAVEAAQQLVEAEKAAFASLKDNLVSYWPLNGDLKDKVVGGNDGTWDHVSDLAYAGIKAKDFKTGKFQGRKAAYLDGTNAIKFVDKNAKYGFTGKSFSISIWFTAKTITKAWQCLVATGEMDAWRIHRRRLESDMTFAAGKWCDRQSDGNIECFYDLPKHNPPHNLTIGGNPETWHHIVGIVNSQKKQVILFFDGYSVGVTGVEKVKHTEYQFYIGKNPDKIKGVATKDDLNETGRNWNGKVCDVAIWDRPLTKSEVLRIYNSKKSLGDILGLTSKTGAEEVEKAMEAAAATVKEPEPKNQGLSLNLPKNESDFEIKISQLKEAGKKFVEKMKKDLDEKSEKSDTSTKEQIDKTNDEIKKLESNVKDIVNNNKTLIQFTTSLKINLDENVKNLSKQIKLSEQLVAKQNELEESDKNLKDSVDSLKEIIDKLDAVLDLMNVNFALDVKSDTKEVVDKPKEEKGEK